MIKDQSCSMPIDCQYGIEYESRNNITGCITRKCKPSPYIGGKCGGPGDPPCKCGNPGQAPCEFKACKIGDPNCPDGPIFPPKKCGMPGAPPCPSDPFKCKSGEPNCPGPFIPPGAKCPDGTPQPCKAIPITPIPWKLNPNVPINQPSPGIQGSPTLTGGKIGGGANAPVNYAANRPMTIAMRKKKNAKPATKKCKCKKPVKKLIKKCKCKKPIKKVTKRK